MAQLVNAEDDEVEHDYVSPKSPRVDDGTAAEINEEDEPIFEPRKRKAVDDTTKLLPHERSKLNRTGQTLEKYEFVTIVTPEPALRSRSPRLSQSHIIAPSIPPKKTRTLE